MVLSSMDVARIARGVDWVMGRLAIRATSIDDSTVSCIGASPEQHNIPPIWGICRAALSAQAEKALPSDK
jgi:hypothetical protein